MLFLLLAERLLHNYRVAERLPEGNILRHKTETSEADKEKFYR